MNHFDTFIAHIHETISSICFACWAKLPVSLATGMFALLFGLHNGSLLIALIILIVFDLVMGITAAYMRGDPIESRRALKTASKFGVYSVLCSSAFLVEGVVPGTTFLDNAMIAFLALTEFISIMENAGKMGFTVPQKLLNQARELQRK